MRRRPRVLLTCLVLALSGLVAGTAAPAAAAEPVDYVHLGDSYASGPGAGSYEVPAVPCYRSANSYAELWAAARDTRFDNASCAGAVIADVRARQGAALSADTDRVTITIGGNDIGFTQIVAACRLRLGDCTTVNAAARTAIAQTLPRGLAGLLGWLTARAPAATVVVTGYPLPYNATALCLGGVARADRATVNETVRRLNAGLSAAVSALGDAQVVFAPVTELFEGHRLCDRGTRYLHDLDSSDVPAGAYHPTADGQRYGYLPAVSAA